MSESNWVSAILAALGSGFISYLISRLSKAHDARSAAEAALIGTGPAIIAEQNRRIQDVQEDNNRLWQQVKEGYERERRCQYQVNTLTSQISEQRNQIRDLQQKVMYLEQQIADLKRV